eukprot:scaffold3787_cov131-Cylindrotheca_fusiformis.AAC.2
MPIALERVGLQEGLEQLGDFAFMERERLERVEIPSTVRVIGDNAFMEQCSVSRRDPQYHPFYIRLNRQ